MHRVKLAKFCGGRQHQNVVLKCGRIGYTDIRSMKDIVMPGAGMNDEPEEPVEGKFYLFLDQVTERKEAANAKRVRRRKERRRTRKNLHK